MANALLSPQTHQLVKLRGSTWRFLKEQDGFWQLELLKTGAHFSEKQIHVWALPGLEKEHMEILSDEESLSPFPTEEQRVKGKTLPSFLQAQKSQLITSVTGSEEPLAAKNCAIYQKEWQFEPWRRIVQHLPFPRILIADDVGLGKTTEAAIVLAELAQRRRAERILIVAPNHLTEKWQDELYERFGMAFEIFTRQTREKLADRGVKNPWEIAQRIIVSRDFVKRWENLKPLESVQWDAVVIDECHHFIKQHQKAPTRLRELAEKIVYNSPALILLSATPFTGSENSFRSIMSLIDPKYNNHKEKDWFRYRVRRLKKDLSQFGEPLPERKVQDVEITPQNMSQEEISLFEDVHSTLLKHRERGSNTWDFLLEETARKRLSSSWAAFFESITGTTRLSDWFDEKLKKRIYNFTSSHSSAKLQKLASVLDTVFKNPESRKVVIFTEALANLELIKTFLTKKKGYKDKEILCIQGNTGSSDRLRIEEDFTSMESPAKILIATDTISEGKDLQHSCHHLINFELPWSLIKMEQRAGRIDRLQQKKPPHIINLCLNTEATADQRVIQKLMHKLQTAYETLGSVTSILEHFDDLTLSEINQPEKVLAEIDQLKTETNPYELAEDELSLSQLSAQPLSAENDSSERAKLFSLMLKDLGGTFEAYGKAANEYLISVPSDWDLEILRQVGEDLPTDTHPWRVTFDGEIFLSYEESVRLHGAPKLGLHFLSPIHPIVEQVENRFRSRLLRKGFPVYTSRDLAYPYVALIELSAKSPSSRVAAQKLIALELGKMEQIDSSLIQDLQTINGASSLPSKKTWQQLTERAQKCVEEFASDLSKDFSKQQEKFLNEVQGSDELLKKRRQWIEDIWSIDVKQSHYRILGLICPKKS